MFKHKLYLVGGLPQHGKSTVASFLSSLSNLRSGNTSDVIYSEASLETGIPEQDLRSWPKQGLRGKLVETGDRLCKDDPAFLIKKLAESGVQVITGLRKPAELESIRDFATVVVIWVIRPGSKLIQDNTLLTSDCADHIILNDGTLDSLYAKTAQLHLELSNNSALRTLV